MSGSAILVSVLFAISLYCLAKLIQEIRKGNRSIVIDITLSFRSVFFICCILVALCIFIIRISSQ